MPIEEDILIIIEEPETHLHPAAHGNLAERFVDSYLEDNRRKYLIETHSENFVLRIQRLIASKKIDRNDVKIYYVDYNESDFSSNLNEIKIEDDGEIEDWPDNVFNESLDEVIKLRKAQKDRENAS
jgi:predicted ATPase